CSRYGLVSCARRLGIVRTLSARQLVQFVGQPTLELYRVAAPILTLLSPPAGGQAASASIAPRAHRLVADHSNAARDRRSGVRRVANPRRRDAYRGRRGSTRSVVALPAAVADLGGA